MCASVVQGLNHVNNECWLKYVDLIILNRTIFFHINVTIKFHGSVKMCHELLQYKALKTGSLKFIKLDIIHQNPVWLHDYGSSVSMQYTLSAFLIFTELRANILIISYQHPLASFSLLKYKYLTGTISRVLLNYEERSHYCDKYNNSYKQLN